MYWITASKSAINMAQKLNNHNTTKQVKEASKVTGAIDYQRSQSVDFESVVYDSQLQKYVDAQGK